MNKLTPTLANMFLIGTHITKDVSMKLAMYKGFLMNTQTLYPDELESVRTHDLRVKVYLSPDKYVMFGIEYTRSYLKQQIQGSRHSYKVGVIRKPRLMASVCIRRYNEAQNELVFIKKGKPTCVLSYSQLKKYMKVFIIKHVDGMTGFKFGENEQDTEIKNTDRFVSCAALY